MCTEVLPLAHGVVNKLSHVLIIPTDNEDIFWHLDWENSWGSKSCSATASVTFPKMVLPAEADWEVFNVNLWPFGANAVQFGDITDGQRGAGASCSAPAWVQAARGFLWQLQGGDGQGVLPQGGRHRAQNQDWQWK